jgi:hypothetical protein
MDAAHQATRAATRARDGTRAPLSGPARRGIGACVRTDPTWLGAGISLLPPSRRAPAACLARGKPAPPWPPGWSSPGQIGAFAQTVAALGFKGRVRPQPERTNHQPHWGFPSFTGGHAVREREQTRRRHVEPGEGADATGRRRHAKDDVFNCRSWEGEEAVRVRRGSRTGAGTSTSPGTPTSPRHRPSSSRLRLHRHPDVSITAATFLFPPSLSSSLFSTSGVGVRRRMSMPGCWPSSHSIAASRATHAPGPAVAMRGPSVIAGHRAERAVQEMFCAAASPRDVPLVTRRPRRATKARPRVRYARLWPAHVQRAPCEATGQPSREGRRRGAQSSRGDFDPGSPPTRVCTGVKPGADLCVPLLVEGVDAMQ